MDIGGSEVAFAVENIGRSEVIDRNLQSRNNIVNFPWYLVGGIDFFYHLNQSNELDLGLSGYVTPKS